jgi:hypothetical protein
MTKPCEISPAKSRQQIHISMKNNGANAARLIEQGQARVLGFGDKAQLRARIKHGIEWRLIKECGL